jgi:hypothetical protein
MASSNIADACAIVDPGMLKSGRWLFAALSCSAVQLPRGGCGNTSVDGHCTQTRPASWAG